MRRLLLLSAAVEGATALFLMLAPAFFLPLLLGADSTEAELAVARLCGIALMTAVIACWPRKQPGWELRRQWVALLFYNGAAAVLLAYLGWGGKMSGILLWPAAIYHLAMTGALAVSNRLG